MCFNKRAATDNHTKKYVLGSTCRTPENYQLVDFRIEIMLVSLLTLSQLVDLMAILSIFCICYCHEKIYDALFLYINFLKSLGTCGSLGY